MMYSKLLYTHTDALAALQVATHTYTRFLLNHFYRSLIYRSNQRTFPLLCLSFLFTFNSSYTHTECNVQRSNCNNYNVLNELYILLYIATRRFACRLKGNCSLPLKCSELLALRKVVKLILTHCADIAKEERGREKDGERESKRKFSSKHAKPT